MSRRMRALAALAAVVLFPISFSGVAARAQTAPPAAGKQAQGTKDFEVTSGKSKFRLSEARGKYVALHFLLRTECPMCIGEIREYTENAPKVAGVVHVFLKPDAPADIEAFTKKLDGPAAGATVYRDADEQVAAQFGIPEGYLFHGQSVRYPALVVLGPDGAELFRHVGKANTDRLHFADFAKKLADATRTDAVAQFNLDKERLAIAGYDPVAYFDGRAAKGDAGFATEYRGVIYQFASAANRDKFVADPQRYLPAYGGWCATAMADGRKVEIDPTNFRITGGRLFLFYKGLLGDAQNDWKKDEPNQTKRADVEWKKFAPADVASPTSDRKE